MSIGKIRILTVIFCMLCAIALSGFAWADCSKFETNQKWISLQNKFGDLIRQEKNLEAIEVGRSLERMCDESPMLNYSMGMLYRRTGDLDRALDYLRRATEQSQGVNVGEKNLENIWYARYEVEHGDEVIALTKEQEENREKIERLTRLLRMGDGENAEFYRREHLRTNILMWTGVGVSAVGIVMAAIGAVLKVQDNKTINWVRMTGEDSYEVNLDTKFEMAWGILGAGIFATVTGAVMTGIGAYQYTHPINPKVELTDSLSMTWDVGLTGIDVGLTF